MSSIFNEELNKAVSDKDSALRLWLDVIFASKDDVQVSTLACTLLSLKLCYSSLHCCSLSADRDRRWLLSAVYDLCLAVILIWRFGGVVPEPPIIIITILKLLHGHAFIGLVLQLD